MEQLQPKNARAFLERWGDLHDAVVEEVTFDLPKAMARLRMRAQDRDAGWAYVRLHVLIEGLSEFTYRQPANYDVQVVFEAGLCWDGTVVLFALDAPSTADPSAYREVDTYFGGRSISWVTIPL